MWFRNLGEQSWIFLLSRIATIDVVPSGRSLPFEKIPPGTVGQVTDSLAGERRNGRYPYLSDLLYRGFVVHRPYITSGHSHHHFSGTGTIPLFMGVGGAAVLLAELCDLGGGQAVRSCDIFQFIQ